MKVFVIIFMVIASIMAIGTLGYVIFDIVLKVRNKDKTEKEKDEDPVDAPPVADITPPEVMPETVEHVDAEKADTMTSDLQQ